MARRDELAELTAGFIAAFNDNDLEAMMSYFAPHGVYDEFNARINEGAEAVREAFTPQFSGAFGEMKFLDEDLFIDEATGKVMASWRCTLTVKGEPTSWRGLDLLWWATSWSARSPTPRPRCPCSSSGTTRRGPDHLDGRGPVVGLR